MCVPHGFLARRAAVLLSAVLAASSASATTAEEEKPDLIQISKASAAPPETAEARIALRQHREAAVLNRFTFPGNVLIGNGDLVDHWIVMFCPGWHGKCQSFLPSYEVLGVQWENKLNTALMASRVRFAKVDCATEKSLCVSLGIDDYPSVVHYHNHEQVSSWHGGAPGLVRFVKQALEGPKRAPSPRPKGRVSRWQQEAMKSQAIPTCSAGGPSTQDAPATEHVHVENGMRTLVFAFLLTATLLGTLVHLRSYVSKHALPKDAPRQSFSKLDGNRLQGSGCPSKKEPASTRSAPSPPLPQEWARERSSIVL